MNNPNFNNLKFFNRIEQYENLFDLLYDLISRIKDLCESNLNNENDQKSNLIDRTINDCSNIEEILKQIPFFNDEHYYFTSINLMSSYIFLNKLSDNYQLVLEILYEFYILINSKIKMKPESYKKLYDEFLFKLDKYEDKFYTQIYEKSEFYDDEILANVCYALLN